MLSHQVKQLSSEQVKAILKAHPMYCLEGDHPEIGPNCYPHLQELSSTMVYGFKDGLCGQGSIPNILVGSAKTLLGVKDGDCASVGYTQYKDDYTNDFFGTTFTFDRYSKPTLQELSTTMVYGFKDGLCGQGNIPNALVGSAETLLGVKEGDCASVGYTQYKDEYTNDFFGTTFTFDRYAKPALQQLYI